MFMQVGGGALTRSGRWPLKLLLVDIQKPISALQVGDGFFLRP
jgi:hypothetical protein